MSRTPGGSALSHQPKLTICPPGDSSTGGGFRGLRAKLRKAKQQAESEARARKRFFVLLAKSENETRQLDTDLSRQLARD